jgi:hypothetical protein
LHPSALAAFVWDATCLVVAFEFAHRMFETQCNSLRIRVDNAILLQRLAVEKNMVEAGNQLSG